MAEPTRYRIVPYLSDSWKVQRRSFWLWWDISRMVGIDTFESIYFSLESEAEAWIKQRLAAEARANELLRLEREHKRRYAPRPFP